MTTNSFGSHPTLQKDLDEKDVVEKETVVGKFREIAYDGNKYVQDKNTNEIYHPNDYRDAKLHGITMYPIGKQVDDKIHIFKR